MPRWPARRAAPTGCAEPIDAWDRARRWWDLIFYGLLALASLSALSDRPWTARHWAILALAPLFALWYWALVGRAGPQREHVGWMLLYCGGAFAFWLALVILDPSFFLVLFALYNQLYNLLPLRPAFAGAALFTAAVIWRNAGLLPPAALPTLIVFGVITLLVGWWFAKWVGTIITQSHERRLLIEQLEATRRELADSERQAGSMTERQRLAGEIHDTLAQGFVSVVLHLEAAEAALDRPAFDDGALRRHLDDARRVARENLAEARRLVWALRPELLEGSNLAAALARVVRRWGEETGIVAEFAAVGDERQLLPEREVALLRAAQEALSNIRKHARAANVVVTLTYLDDAALLDVQDDGRGFDPEAAVPFLPDGDGGFGLRAMRERVASLGGTLALESAPGDGTTLAIELPDACPRARPLPDCAVTQQRAR